MKLKQSILVLAVAIIAGCVSIGRSGLADRIVGTWQKKKVEGPGIAEYTNDVRFAERTFCNNGTYQTRAGKSAATAFCASSTYTCVSSRLEMISSAGDRKCLQVSIAEEMLVLTDGTNTGWLIRSTK